MHLLILKNILNKRLLSKECDLTFRGFKNVLICEKFLHEAFIVLRIDHVNFVYNKCDHVHSLASLAGKILHWSDGKVDILCHNSHINPRVKVKADKFRDVPLSSYQTLI